MFCTRPAQAQEAVTKEAAPKEAHEKNGIIHTIAQNFLGLNGYWLTAGSGTKAIGTPKFGSNTDLFFRPAHRWGLEITGGGHMFGAKDHWLPFSGGNHFDMTGLAFRISKTRSMNTVAPFVTVGYYYGEVHSKIFNANAYDIVPSATVGAEYRFARYLSLKAQYRFNGYIHGIDTSGFSAGISVF